MMFRTPIFALCAAAMTLAAEGANITITVSVDSHIESVTLRSGYQSDSVDRGESETWSAWSAGSAYTASASSVDTGYTARWKVTTNGVVALSGGVNNTITLSSAFNGCTLNFYGEPNTYAVTLDRQSGSGGSSSVTAAYGLAMPAITKPTRMGYTFGGYYTSQNGGGTQYYAATGASARNWDRTSATTLCAKWTANTYKMNVHPNGGTFNGSTGAVQISPNSGGTYLTTGKAAFSAIGKATRSGYTLTGYYDAATGGTQVYDANGHAVSGTYWNGNGSSATFKGLTSATSLTVYARWTVNTYNVQLDRQGGSDGTASVTATYDAAMPSATKPTRLGYTFGGYYTLQNGGGTQYYTASCASARTWNIASNTILYAKWTANAYELNVHPNGGTFNGSTGSTRVSPNSGGTYLTTGKAAFSAIGKATRTGYTLTGYYDAATGGKQVYDANGHAVNGTYWDGSGGTAKFKGLPSASSLTVWAHWTVNTYTVTLNRQGGSGGTASVTATYDAAMPSATMPTRRGYAFEGYYTATNGGTQYYTATGASARKWNIASNATLYAQWTARKYELSVNPNGGVFRDSTDPVQVSPNAGGTYLTTGKSAFSTIGKATQRGHALTGYFDARTGGAKVFDANGGAVNGTYWDGTGGSAKFKGLANASATALAVYAQWTANVYRVTFHANGGSVSPSAKNVEFGKPYGTLPTPTREYCSFDGWFTASGGGERVTASAIYDITEGQTLYAHWTQNSYVVNYKAFDKNGGLIGGGLQTIEMGVSTYLKSFDTLAIRSPDGYSFTNWNTAMDGSGDSHEDHENVFNLTNEANATVTLYAQWTPNPYEVAFWPNGADGGETMDNQSFTYDVTQNLNAVEFTYTGRSFEQWSSDTNYTYRTQYYADGEAVANLATGGVVNLYAKWTNIVYTVAFDANGGEEPPGQPMNPMVCTYTVPMNLPACTFTRDGWGFSGWTNAVGEAFADRARVTNLTATAETPLFACWTGVTYAVTLDARDPKGNAATNSAGEVMGVLTNFYTVGEAWNLPGDIGSVDTHYSFNGWGYVDAEGHTNVVSRDDEVPPPSVGVKNLVAIWSWVSDDLATAVDAPSLPFATFGTAGSQGHHDEDRYPADWIVQTEVVSNSPSAVQSGRLPVSGSDTYVSWLTLEVEGPGVLSFWWKCSATDRRTYEYQDQEGHDIRVVYGDAFHFGKYDGTEGGFTNLTAELEGITDWRQVVYTNKTSGLVTFAWKFQFRTFNNDPIGGGTGWVDRVTWTPDESAAEDVTSEHSVPFTWLREKFPDETVSADADALETLAEGDSPNGKPMKVWQEYWAGTDPNDPNDLFRANIVVSNDMAHISWYPDLSVTGRPERVYHVWGSSTLPAEWGIEQSNVVEELEVELPEPGGSGAPARRFFKVELDWRESQKN